MKLPETTYSATFDFDGYEIQTIVAEQASQYSCFELPLKESQAKQQKVYESLEIGIPLFDGSAFREQVHFQFAFQTPVQRWYPYREGYSIRLVDAFLKELNVRGNVLDPFVGSGTTLLSCRRNGLSSYGLDVNPISVMVSKAENDSYSKTDISQLRKQYGRLEALPNSDKEYETPFNLVTKVFNAKVLQALLHIKSHIDNIKGDKARNLCLVAWLSVIESVSNIKKEGNGIKYRNRRRTPSGYIEIAKETWESQNLPCDKFHFVKQKILDRLGVIIRDLEFDYGDCSLRPEVHLGNCLDFDKILNREIEFTFFSPPYCNSFDYFEIHKVELWLGRFVNSRQELNSFRKNSFRSNAGALADKPIFYRNESIENLIELFDSIKLWSGRIPNVIRGYFDDMHTLLNKLYIHTTKSGKVGIVVGNSAYSSVIIPTDILIARIASELGFKIKGIFVARHLTTSSQQKKDLEPLKDYLRESIVLLEK